MDIVLSWLWRACCNDGVILLHEPSANRTETYGRLTVSQIKLKLCAWQYPWNRHSSEEGSSQVQWANAIICLRYIFCMMACSRRLFKAWGRGMFLFSRCQVRDSILWTKNKQKATTVRNNVAKFGIHDFLGCWHFCRTLAKGEVVHKRRNFPFQCLLCKLAQLETEIACV